MYNIRCSLPENRAPWNIPLQDRLQTLTEAQKQGKKIAAMLYQQADTSTFRYRCYNVFQATKESKEWQCIYFYMDEVDSLLKVLQDCSLLILARLQWQHKIDNIIASAHGKNIPVLFDVDDLVWNIQYIRLVTNTLNVHFGGEVDYTYWFSYISRMEFTASLVDGFITTNDFLGKKLQERFGKPYQVIQNSLNLEQLEISAKCAGIKARKETQRPFTIGYFSGTPSHINDFKMIYREIIQLLEDYPNMTLQVVGFMEFPEEMQPLIQAGRVVFSPLVDFVELQRLVAQVDVNVVPLVQNTFTNCKSELKFFEAAVVDTVTVATPTYTYENSIEDGKTGFLCRPGQWYDRIVHIYKHPEETAQIVSAAKKYCLHRYCGDAFVEQIENAYNYFVK